AAVLPPIPLVMQLDIGSDDLLVVTLHAPELLGDVGAEMIWDLDVAPVYHDVHAPSPVDHSGHRHPRTPGVVGGPCAEAVERQLGQVRTTLAGSSPACQMGDTPGSLRRHAVAGRVPSGKARVIPDGAWRPARPPRARASRPPATHASTPA